MTTFSTISKHDLLWLRDRAVAATDLSVLIADARLPDTPIVDVNPAFERLTGYGSGEAMGRNCRFLQGPGTDPEAIRRMRSAIDGSRQFTEVVLNYRRDGTPFWNELNVSPVHDADGTLSHFVGLQQDVTERERANRQLQLLVETSELMGRSNPPEDVLKAVARVIVPRLADYCTIHLRGDDDAVSWLTTSGVDQNVARAIGDFEHEQTAEGNTGSAVATVMRSGTPIFRKSSAQTLGEIAASDAYRRLLELHEWQATMIVPIIASDHLFGSISLSQVKSGFAFTHAHFTMAQDVGRRIGGFLDSSRLMRNAQAALVARERFLSTAAHELRTPVASIKGYAQLLLRSLDRGTLTRDRLRQAIRTVDASVARLSSLTDDLLAMSQHGSREMPLRIEPIHTVSFLASVANRSALLYDHRIIVNTSAADGYFAGDVAKIDQVMSNLLSNAAKYSEPDKPIMIEATRDGGGVRITVRDVGIGLHEDELQTIFELFGTSAHPSASSMTGLGLGLFISRNIVERHGGRLWAESAGRGHGSSIHVWLPPSPPEASSDAPGRARPKTA